MHRSNREAILATNREKSLTLHDMSNFHADMHVPINPRSVIKMHVANGSVAWSK
jgi:alkyl sulfatase BDS1-like metallo-beta-lactamase superfamily hydrolase